MNDAAQTQKAKHTPTPWLWAGSSNFLVGPDGNTVQIEVPEDRHDVEHARHAVNVHDDMLAALRELYEANQETIDTCGGDRDTHDRAINRSIAAMKQAAAAIAKAEGRTP